MPELSEKDRLFERMLDLATQIRNENDPKRVTALVALLTEALNQSVKYQQLGNNPQMTEKGTTF